MYLLCHMHRFSPCVQVRIYNLNLILDFYSPNFGKFFTSIFKNLYQWIQLKKNEMYEFNLLFFIKSSDVLYTHSLRMLKNSHGNTDINMIIFFGSDLKIETLTSPIISFYSNYFILRNNS
jgi:hypothetical protein